MSTLATNNPYARFTAAKPVPEAHPETREESAAPVGSRVDDSPTLSKAEPESVSPPSEPPGPSLSRTMSPSGQPLSPSLSPTLSPSVQSLSPSLSPAVSRTVSPPGQSLSPSISPTLSPPGQPSTQPSSKLSRREKLRTMFDAPKPTKIYRADEIVAVPVRLQTAWERALELAAASGGGDDAVVLPARPAPRGLRSRMGSRAPQPSTGLADPDGEPYQFATFKMPRAEYSLHFRRDRNGKYLGTEPERMWTRELLREKYGQYQHLKLFSSANDAPAEAKAAAPVEAEAAAPADAEAAAVDESAALPAVQQEV